MKRLYRSQSDRMVAGLAGGIAEYFDVDSTWIRLLFLTLAVFSLGTFLVVYLIGWIVVPEAPGATPRRQRLYRSREERFLGGVAGGLAETWKLDPTLIRLALVTGAFVTGGFLILIYLAAWMIMPLEPPHALPPGGSDAHAIDTPARQVEES